MCFTAAAAPRRELAEEDSKEARLQHLGLPAVRIEGGALGCGDDREVGQPKQQHHGTRAQPSAHSGAHCNTGTGHGIESVIAERDPPPDGGMREKVIDRGAFGIIGPQSCEVLVSRREPVGTDQRTILKVCSEEREKVDSADTAQHQRFRCCKGAACLGDSSSAVVRTGEYAWSAAVVRMDRQRQAAIFTPTRVPTQTHPLGARDHTTCRQNKDTKRLRDTKGD
eukprot:5569823-Prymnesium_polylepis.1